MDRGVAFAVVVVAGAGVAIQAPINGALGRSVGGVAAALISFLAGTLALSAVGLATGAFGRLGAHPVAWQYVAGGLLGAVYVTVALMSVRTLGAAGLTAATIAGQLTMATAIDRFGLLGVERSGLGVARVAGLALLAAGAYLVVSD